VQVDDPGVGASPDSSTEFTLAVTDINEAPTSMSFDNAVAAIDENVTVGGGIKVADIVVTDDALGTETLSLTGADADKFAIVGSELRYIGPSPDFETQSSYSVTVNVNDESLGAPGSVEVSENFTLTVNDVNEAPTAVSLINTVTAIDENVAVGVGIKVADIVVTDDALGTETLTLTGADADKFEIVGNELHYIGPSPDFETQSSYSVTVNVNDESLGAPGSVEVSENFTLAINDVDGLILTGDAGDNNLNGTPEIDTLDYSATTMGVTVNLGAGTASGPEIGNDTVTGFENVIGGSGDDTLRGHPGNNQLYGGDGNDFLAGGLGGTDLFDGGNGLDRVSFHTSVNSVDVDLAAGTAVIGGFDKTFVSVEFIRGTDQNDTYDATGFSGSSINAGSSGPLNEFEGMGGDDTVTGNGNTRVSYVNAEAAVTVTLNADGSGSAIGTAPGDAAGIGTDTFTGGVTAVRGSNFNDTLTGSAANELFEGWGGDDEINGGGGLDRTRYDINNGAALVLGISVNMASGVVTGRDATATAVYGTDTLRSVEFVRGTNADDVYDATGFSGASLNAGSNMGLNEFEGMGGDDQITGNGATRVSYQNALAGVTVTLGAMSSGSAASTAPGDAAGIGTDTFVSGVTRIRGSEFGDIITGNGADNIVEGLGGGDVLNGGAGNDTIDGGAGNDVLNGGVGNDTLSGGDGIDIAVFSGLRSAYTFGAGTVTGPDGMDSTNGIELLQFDDSFMLGFGLTPIDLSGFALPNANPLFGRGVADLLTIDTSFNGRLINLGADTDTLTLQEFGTPVYNLNIVNVENVVSTGGIDTVNLQNAATGLSVDLGVGIDTLNLASGANSLTVANVEVVNGNDGVDTIVIAGNAIGATTVTGGGGADVMTASADQDYFRFTNVNDSAYDVPGGGQRDVISGFNAAQDVFVLEGFGSTGTWELINDGGADVLRIDVNNDSAWDMAIELNGLTETLTNGNFNWLV
jgi:Ca2+-binding RTX toxin-like protein